MCMWWLHGHQHHEPQECPGNAGETAQTEARGLPVPVSESPLEQPLRLEVHWEDGKDPCCLGAFTILPLQLHRRMVQSTSMVQGANFSRPYVLKTAALLLRG